MTTRFPIPLASHTLSAGHGSYFDLETEEFDSNMLLTEGRLNSHVAYQVTGDSAVPYIPSGAWVIVDKYREPQNGDVIACYLNDLYFVKIFERKEHRLRLVSPNEDYPPQEVFEHDDFHVLGVVTGCVIKVVREIQTRELGYRLTGFRPEGKGFRASFDRDDGQPVEITITRECMRNGIRWATKALSRNVLRWKK